MFDERVLKLTVFDVHKRQRVIGHATYPLCNHNPEESAYVWRDLERELPEVCVGIVHIVNVHLQPYVSGTTLDIHNHVTIGTNVHWPQLFFLVYDFVVNIFFKFTMSFW
jgi:hypothetical protein